VSALLALSAASGVIYALAKNDVLTLNGQSQGILTVLVFGAATDYALLLVARYREELHLHENHFDAMKRAWLGVVEPITASATTVIIGLLCLLLSELNSNKSTGPVASIGIACALITTLTVLPALLVIPSVPTVLLFLAGLAIAFGAVKAPLFGVGWLLVWVGVVSWFFLRRRLGVLAEDPALRRGGREADRPVGPHLRVHRAPGAVVVGGDVGAAAHRRVLRDDAEGGRAEHRRLVHHYAGVGHRPGRARRALPGRLWQPGGHHRQG
jgi:hypothetical protein